MPMSPPPAAPPAVAEDEEGMPPSPPPPPPPSPPAVAAADDEERPWPAMKVKLFPYAMYCVFGGMGRTDEILLVAFVVIHYLLMIARVLSFHTDGGVARFFTLASRVLSFLCCASITFIMAMFIRYYMRVDGEYHVEFDPPPRKSARAAAAAAEQLQLPPPPPEMDIC